MFNPNDLPNMRNSELESELNRLLAQGRTEDDQEVQQIRAEQARRRDTVEKQHLGCGGFD